MLKRGRRRTYVKKWKISGDKMYDEISVAESISEKKLPECANEEELRRLEISLGILFLYGF